MIWYCTLTILSNVEQTEYDPTCILSWLPLMHSRLSMFMYIDCLSKTDFCATAPRYHENWAPECLEPAKNIENEQHVSSSNTAVHFITWQKAWGRWGEVSCYGASNAGTTGVWCFSLRCWQRPSRSGRMTKMRTMGESTEKRGQGFVGGKSPLEVESVKAMSRPEWVIAAAELVYAVCAAQSCVMWHVV